MSSLESVLKACDASDLLSALADMGISNVDEIVDCEPQDLCDDLGIDLPKANAIVEKAKETSLFVKRKEAVQRTWKAVEDALAVDATKLFYQHLFETYPNVQPLFANADMDSQAEKLFKTVGLAVKYLDDVDGLIPLLEEMGKKHATAYHCKREHYEAVGECLLWTLKTGLKDAWTKDVADAWTWVYGVIAKTMADGGDEALFDQRKAAVQSSWKMVQEALDVQATKLFYKRLFEDYPEVMPLFAHADMDVQSEKLYKTVGLAVQYLDNMDELVPILHDLGRRHKAEWRTETAHYDAVGKTLVSTLATGLGDAWTPDVADAWEWVYGVLAKTMGEGADMDG